MGDSRIGELALVSVGSGHAVWMVDCSWPNVFCHLHGILFAAYRCSVFVICVITAVALVWNCRLRMEMSHALDRIDWRLHRRHSLPYLKEERI